jgi:uncharacterized protein
MTAQYDPPLFITYSGVIIDLSDIRIEDINIQDIAHHLTKICRYGGAMKLGQHYSVAQHSILLYEYAKKHHTNIGIAKYALMHDTSEYILGDIPNGLKKLLPDYRVLEDNLSTLIYQKYNIKSDQSIKDIVKDLDKRILLDESSIFTSHHKEFFKHSLRDLDPLDIYPSNECCDLCLEEIKSKFLHLCAQLNIKD